MRSEAVNYTETLQERMARVLVIDDDEQLGAALRRALAYEGYQVSLARDGSAGLRQAREEEPDLVVLDVLMPGLDGFEVCRRLRAGGDVPVLMLTARDDVADRVLGLTRQMPHPVAKCRGLAGRARPAGWGKFFFAVFCPVRAANPIQLPQRGDRRIELSTREYELLALFLRHPRQVLTRDMIFDRVWNYDFGRDSNLIEVYVGYLRQKLEREGEPRLIHTVRGAGYVLRE